MPNKNKGFEYHGVQYDSKEEIEFQQFLEEGVRYGLVERAVYQPDTYVLIPKATRPVVKRLKTKADRVEQRSMFREHSYTPDWSVTFTDKFFKEFPGHRHKLMVLDPNGSNTQIADPTFQGVAHCLFDVKGKINLHGGDRIFPIHQKLMWQVFKLPVNKLIPEEFFRRIGAVPDQVKWMKNRKNPTPRKAYIYTPTFKDLYGQQKAKL